MKENKGNFGQYLISLSEFHLVQSNVIKTLCNKFYAVLVVVSGEEENDLQSTNCFSSITSTKEICHYICMKIQKCQEVVYQPNGSTCNLYTLV